MILGPSPLFGRSAVYKGAIRHLAFNSVRVASGGVVTVDHKARASADGKRWYPPKISGDLAKATSSAKPEGAFQPSQLATFKGRHYLFGALWKSETSAEAAVFSSADKRKWDKETTPYPVEGTLGSDAFMAVAANGDYLVGLKPGGQIIWTDGLTWSGRNDLPLSGAGYRAYVMTGAAGGFAIGGNGPSNSVIISAPTPGGAWAVRSQPFGINTITAAASGDVALVFGHYNPSNSPNQLVSAPLTNLTTWTVAPFVANRYIAKAAYGAGRWFAGSAGVWVTSTAGAGPWTDAAAKPWAEGETGAIRSLYHDRAAWIVHYDNGKLARSEDNGGAWDRPANSGLAADANYVAAYLG